MGELMNNQPTITIAAACRNRDFVIDRYLDHINNISYPKHLLSLCFLINDSKDKTESILREFKQLHNHEYASITIETMNRKVPEDIRSTKVRNEYIYNHLSILKNHIMSKVNTDKLLFIDSDILVPDDIINNLLNADKDIISSLIYNGYLVSPEAPHKYPNIMRLEENGQYKHISNYYVKNASTLTEQKLCKVDLTGAVFLLDKKVYKNVKFGYHPQGEDAYFCKMAQDQGFELWCDIATFSRHIMSKDM
ncbi:glycosyltransferase family protein [Paenibacillus tianjinensis]|uniref:Glycosyl transferase family 8 n=1 Tax=Paenibacillus tianjinensis TaxID=2810347 RepID=A0ABX7L5Y5_9BACL|nr:glycosyltransferase family 2 protein [Paenibacillus tianjinensis]QSF43538.1 hypothetical protein JRJ22_19960 [Paenibacillus tianjinensis]